MTSLQVNGRRSFVTRAFVTLDGMRGIAALMIAIRHAPAFLWQSADGPRFLFYESYLAVDFFFVLSGFVLAHAYGDRLGRGLSVGRFFVIRMIRLYPLYFLAFTIWLVFALSRAAVGKTDFGWVLMHGLAAVLFLPDPFSDSHLFPANPVAWSLFDEVVVNIVFAVIARYLSTWVLGVVVGLAGAILFLSGFNGWFGFGTAHGATLDGGTQWSSIGAGLIRVGFSFFAGVLIYRLRNRLAWKVSLPPWLLLAVLAAVLVWFPTGVYQTAFDLTATLLLFPALVFMGADSIPGTFSRRLYGWLGGISYALYVLQMPVYMVCIAVTNSVALRQSGNLDHIARFWGLGSVVVAVLAACVADRFFDRPARRRLMALVTDRSRFA